MSRNLDTFQFTKNADNAVSSQGWVANQGNVVNALAGDDTIEGFGSDDSGILNYGTIYTADGNDRIVAKGGRDTIYNTGTIDTGNGNDTISGDVNDTANSDGIENDGKIFTGDGDDIITGNAQLDNDFGAIIDTGSGNDKIIFNQSTQNPYRSIWNDGLIDTGSGNDIVDALRGGFFGDTEGRPSGEIRLGDGEDTLIGFGTGGFFGGTGIDKILFGEGTYKISESTIVSDGRTMRVAEFEQIGGANGGLFNYENGTLTVDAAGIATFTSAISPSTTSPSTSTKPANDVLTGIKVLDSSTGTTRVTGDDGIIDRFTLQTNSAPSTPFNITTFNPAEDFLQIPQELLGGTVKQSFFSVAKVVVPDRTLTKKEQKAFKKQQKAVSKSVKRIGRTGDGFAYNQLTGELFIDTNGKKKGFGEGGGLLAVLEDTPAIGIDNFQFL